MCGVYLMCYEMVLCFVRVNCELIVYCMFDCLYVYGKVLFDVYYNFVVLVMVFGEYGWLYCKGLMLLDVGVVVIFGLCGDYSYFVVLCLSEYGLFLFVYGVGCKWMCSECKDWFVCCFMLV